MMMIFALNETMSQIYRRDVKLSPGQTITADSKTARLKVTNPLRKQLLFRPLPGFYCNDRKVYFP